MINIPLDTIKEKIKEKTGISNEEIDQRIKKKLDQLAGLISKEGAAHIVANELGVKLQEASGSVKIKNIIAGMKNLETIGKTLRKYDVRAFSTEKRSGKIGKFLIADETGTTLIVLWNDKADLLATFNEGDIIKIIGATARENNGRVELHVGDQSTIEINPAGVKIVTTEQQTRQAATRKKINELTEIDQSVEVLATIVQIFDLKFFKVNQDTGKKMAEDDSGNFTYGCVLNLFIDDGTDNIRTVLWKNQIINLLGISEAELVALKDSPELFEQKKTDLLGLIIKINGRINKNTLFNRLELVANTVMRDVDPEDEIKKMKAETKTTSPEPKTETKTESSKQETKETKKEEKKETALTEEVDDDLLSLEDIEDLEDDL
ncbi:MAG: OB-fold nucleic acid binding domain-containing protein [Candidatus Nanoarchaeia archaeon]